MLRHVLVIWVCPLDAAAQPRRQVGIAVTADSCCAPRLGLAVAAPSLGDQLRELPCLEQLLLLGVRRLGVAGGLDWRSASVAVRLSAAARCSASFVLASSAGRAAGPRLAADSAAWRLASSAHAVVGLSTTVSSAAGTLGCAPADDPRCADLRLGRRSGPGVGRGWPRLPEAEDGAVVLSPRALICWFVASIWSWRALAWACLSPIGSAGADVAVTAVNPRLAMSALRKKLRKCRDKADQASRAPRHRIKPGSQGPDCAPWGGCGSARRRAHSPSCACHAREDRSRSAADQG
jgi:hypothetical protein